VSVAGVPGSSLPASGLPVVNQTLEPAWVRKGSASTQKAYQTALAFEEMLVEQLSKSLTATSGLESESGQGGGSSAEAGSSSSPLSSMLPQALTSGVMSAGGLGLAAQMTRQLEGAAAAAQPSVTGGAAPGTTGGASAPTGIGTATSPAATAPANADTDPSTSTGGTSA